MLVLALAVLAPIATPASAPRFVMPPKAMQGELVTVRVAVKTGSRCFLTVKYADSAGESPAAATSRAGYAQWRWRVSPTAALGPARATVTCGRAGTSTRGFTVVGRLIAPKIVVNKQGFSQKPTFGGGSIVSYGVMLANPSPQQDAIDTFVLVNFIDGANHAIGSASTTVSFIGAGSTYALGNSINLRTAVPVARLEIIIQNHGARPKARHDFPQTQNIQIIPDSFQPQWVGEVDGEVVNDHATMTLGMTNLSIVLFDDAGQVVGGGNGMTFSNIPPGARLVFTAQSGFNAVPTSRAASATVSTAPTYSNT
jgi:hypothetical protein